MAYIFFKTANIFKNLLLEGNQREKRKANVVISLIIFLMLAETVYWSTKTYIWFKIFSVEDPKYTINDVEHFLDAGNILYQKVILYTSNFLPTVFVLTILRTFVLLGQRESFFEFNQTQTNKTQDQEPATAFLLTGEEGQQKKTDDDSGESQKDYVSINSVLEINEEIL